MNKDKAEIPLEFIADDYVKQLVSVAQIRARYCRKDQEEIFSLAEKIALEKFGAIPDFMKTKKQYIGRSTVFIKDGKFTVSPKLDFLGENAKDLIKESAEIIKKQIIDRRRKSSDKRSGKNNQS